MSELGMEIDNKIEQINAVLTEFFKTNIGRYRAKDMMPLFVEKGVWEKNSRNGVYIRNLLRELERENALHRIPFLYIVKKNRNIGWYFQSEGYRTAEEIAAAEAEAATASLAATSLTASGL